MQGAVNWEELGIQASQDRRREPRLPLSVAIEVSGLDLEGKFFCERTRTVDVSESGCSFQLKNGVERGSIVAIRVNTTSTKDEVANKRPFLYQVARSEKQSEGWVIGAAKLQRESIWLVVFRTTNEPQPDH